MSAAVPVMLMRYLALIFECVVKPSLRTRAHEVELRMGLDTVLVREKFKIFGTSDWQYPAVSN